MHKDQEHAPHAKPARKRGRMSPQRQILLGAVFTLPWFISFYLFDARDALAALLALVGYVLIFIGAGRVVLIWAKQRQR